VISRDRDHHRVDDRKLGQVLRAIRHRLGKRQQDVGESAGVSQDVVSRAERGELAAIPIRTLRSVASALGADLTITLRWRGAELDRLLDEGHAALAGAVVQTLERLGWEVHPEVSYSVYGERGSIDLLAWHAPTRTLLVVEIKTELASLEATIRKVDEKVRLAPKVALDRFDWRPRAVSHLIVLPAASTPRRQVRRHASVLDRAFPARGAVVREWLATPTGAIGGLMFVSVTRAGRDSAGGVSRKRIRLTRAERVGRERAATDGANDAAAA
jgi:transcriptional regulator with XRE-family HTH domain